MKRVIYSAQLILAGVLLLFVIPGYLANAPEWYFRLPAVLPPESWSTVLSLIGFVFLVIGLATLVLPLLRAKPATARQDEPVASDEGITLIYNGRKVVGPPALIQSLGTGAGFITVIGLHVRTYVKKWSHEGIVVTVTGINNVPFDQFEYDD